MLFEPLGNFNSVINSQKLLLKEFERLKPNSPMLNLKILSTNGMRLFLIKNIINSVALGISQCYERIKVEDEKAYKEVFSSFECINKIVGKYNISYKEAVKQVRNCFCHGEYWLKIDEEQIKQLHGTSFVVQPFGAYRIYICNNRDTSNPNAIMIEGEIQFDELLKLEYAYSDLYRLYKPINTWIMSSDSKYVQCKNRAMLESYLKNLKRTKIIESKDGIGIEECARILSEKHKCNLKEMMEKLRNFGVDRFKLEDYPLSDEDKEFIKSYIEYIGLDSWQKLYTGDSKYWMTNSERERIRKLSYDFKLIEEEAKKEKYSSDNIFNHKKNI